MPIPWTTLAFGLLDVPLHPILVNFTAALVPVSVLSDWLGKLARKTSLASAGFWAIVYAATVTPATAFAGWWWMRSMADMDHPQMIFHQWLGISLAVLLPPLATWRARAFRGGTPATWGYLAAATTIVAAIVVQGHLGGTMSFGSEEVPTPNHIEEEHDAGPQNHSHHEGASTQPTTLQWQEQIDLKDMPLMKEMHHGG